MSEKIEKNAFFKLSYGLFVLFTNDGERDNASIINTAVQLTENPELISICVNKQNYSEETLRKTGKFNLSVLSKDAPFDLFKRFGFQSGRDTDKLSDFDRISASDNGLKYLSDYSNAYFSAEIVETVDTETHTLFIARVTAAAVISEAESMTYAYYFSDVKPKPKDNGGSTSQKIVGWRCKICNYLYEGESIPEDFICPWCKHPVSDFEPVYG